MAPDRSPSDYCGFLSLPTELRCHIYEYLLADSHTITISAGYVTVFGNRIQDRARKTDIPGLPLDLAPLTRPHYDASLLQVTKPPEVPIDNLNSTEPGSLAMPAPMALMLTCHIINDELTDYDRARRQIKATQAAAAMQEKIATGRKGTSNAMLDVPTQEEGLSLYVSYPYGILVLKSLYPYLVKQATTIHITGYFKAAQTSEPPSPTQSEDDSDGERLTPSGSFEVTRSFGMTRSGRSFRQCQPSSNSSSTTTRPGAPSSSRTRPCLRLESTNSRQNRDTTTLEAMFPPFAPLTTTLAPNILSQLVRTVLPDHKTKLTLLSARILYPGPDPIGTVWAHEDGPVSRILKNMCGGRIHLRVKRGSLGTGLGFSAVPRPRERIVSTGWETWRDTARCRDESRFAELDKFLLEA